MIFIYKVCYNIGEERKVHSNEQVTFQKTLWKDPVKTNEQVIFYKFPERGESKEQLSFFTDKISLKKVQTNGNVLFPINKKRNLRNKGTVQ